MSFVTHRYLKEKGWKAENRSDGIVELSTGIESVVDLVEEVASDRVKFKKNFGHRGAQWHLVDPSESDFKGGTFEELQNNLNGSVDMRPFEEAKDKLVESGLQRKIVPEYFLDSMRRRRTLSEHDGDWDYSRRWDITPFSTAKRVANLRPRIELLCYLSVNCGVSAEEYNRYGAMAWAIAEVLEAAGCQVAITGRFDAKSISGPTGIHAEFSIKRPGEYIAPSLVASCFTTRFYRRVGFMLYCTAAELGGRTAETGLGTSIPADKPVEFSKGRVIIGPRVTDPNCSADLEKALQQAVIGYQKVEEPKYPYAFQPPELSYPWLKQAHEQMIKDLTF